MTIISNDLEKNIKLVYFICIINFLLIIYILYCNSNKKENFGVTEDINAAINTRYGTDVEAIRNLSDLATRLTTGGLTVPGDVEITGTVNIGDPTNKSGSPNVMGAPGKMLVFDNTFNHTPGSGLAANKIRLHNNNNLWIGGFGIETGGVTYSTGEAHKFYVGTGATYGQLALSINMDKTVNAGKFKIGPGPAIGGLLDSTNNVVIDHTTGIIHCKGIKIYNDDNKPLISSNPGAFLIMFTTSTHPQPFVQVPYPIYYSIPNWSSLGIQNRNDNYQISPGYKLEVFTANNYGGTSSIMDNTNGTYMITYFFKDGTQFLINSCKLSYKNTEVVCPADAVNILRATT